MNNFKLEDVYTHAPQKELREVINRKEPHFADPRMKDCIIRTPFHYIVWSTQSNSLNNVQSSSHETLKGKQEVSIPQFLTLLEAFANRKKEVKVQLNAKLVAHVEEGNEVVNLVLDGDSCHSVTRKELVDFQQALKGGGHGFEHKDYVEFPSRKIGQALYDYAASNEVPVSPHQVEGKVEDMYTHLVFGNDGYFWPTRCTPGKTQLTIDQFLAKCQTSPLPKLAGYEVKKVKEGDVYYSDKKAPSDGLGVGCQHISNTQFEALMEAITITK